MRAPLSDAKPVYSAPLTSGNTSPVRANFSSSSSSCTVTAYSDSETYSRDAFLKRGTDFAIFLCDAQDRDTVQETIRVFAQDTAEAVAKASVRTSIDCSTDGDGSFSGSVSGEASASAMASAAAIYEGFLTVDTCSGCSATAELLLSATESVFVEAVAQFDDYFSSFDYGAGEDTDRISEEQLTEDIQTAIIDVFVDVLFNIRASLFTGTCNFFYIDYYTGNEYSSNENEDCTYESCFARITTRDYDYDYPFDYENQRRDSCVGATIRGSDDENTACCELTVSADAFSEFTDAFPGAALEVMPTARQCRALEHGGTIATDVVEATASIFLSTFTFIESTCATQGTGDACSITSAYASAWAEAFANVFADVWIENKPCGCERIVSSRPDFVSSFGELFADAFSDTFGKVCSANDGEASASAFNDAFVSEQIPTLAQAVVTFIEGDDTCQFSVDSVACAGRVAGNNKCFSETTFGQRACNDDDVCVLKNRRNGFCFPRARDAPPDYLGTVIPGCNLGDDYYEYNYE